EMSTPSFLRILSRKAPKGSRPTQPRNTALPPNLAIAQATLAAAPPAFLVKAGAVERSNPSFSATKSIRISPMQNTFFISLERDKVTQKSKGPTPGGDSRSCSTFGRWKLFFKSLGTRSFLCNIVKNNIMRTFVVGNIHSALRALVQLFERVVVGPEDHLIFLGDYVGGWSTAVATVDYLIGLKDRFHCTFLRGNHDALCPEWLLPQKENIQWLDNGGRATRDSYLAAEKETWDLHLQFFGNLENFYVQRGDRLFVHAGFTNLNGIHFEYYEPYQYWDRTLWELAKALNPALKLSDADYPKRLAHFKEIFIGHTPLSKNGV